MMDRWAMGSGRAEGDAMIEATGRRQFLGWAATGAAGLLLPTIARPRPKIFDMGRWRPSPVGPGTIIRLTARTPPPRPMACGDILGMDGPDGAWYGRVVSATSDGMVFRVALERRATRSA
jgi:hypothetical protein